MTMLAVAPPEHATLSPVLREAMTLQEQIRQCVEEALSEGDTLDVAYTRALDCMRSRGQAQPLYELFGRHLVGLVYTGQARMRFDGSRKPSGATPMTPDEFTVLYAAHSAAVLKYLQSRVRHDIAEELTQDVFLAIMRSACFESKGRADWETRAALITRARYMSINHFNREGQLHTSTLDSDDGLSNRLADPTEAGVFTATGERLDLEAVLSSLPAKQRRALELHHGAGHTMTEVARLMDVPYAEAKELAAKAQETLRAILAGEVKPEAPAAAPAKTQRRIDLSQLQTEEALLETMYRIDGEWICLGDMRRHHVKKAQEQHETAARALATIYDTLNPGDKVRQRFTEESLRSLMGSAQEVAA